MKPRRAYLTREQESALVRRWKDHGDEVAMHELVSAHMGMCHTTARRYAAYGLDKDDLLAEGYIGLLEAARRFDLDHGVRFNTYAVWWIKSLMQNFVLHNWSIVRGGTSSSQKRLFFSLRRVKHKLEQQGVRPDEIHRALSRALGVELDEVRVMDDRLSRGDMAMDRQIFSDAEDSPSIVDRFVSPDPTPDQIVEKALDGERALRLAVECLKSRDRHIIESRYLRDDPETLDVIGVRLGISKERVRQLEVRALSTMRVALVGKKQAAMIEGRA